MLAVFCIVAVLHAGEDKTAAKENLLIVSPATESAFNLEWGRYPRDVRAVYSLRHGVPTLSLFVQEAENVKADWRQVYRGIPVAEGQRLEASLRAEGNAHGGHGPSVSLSFFDEKNQRIAHTDMFLGNGATGLRGVKLWAEAPKLAATAQLGLFLHGFGEAHFSEMQVRRVPGAKMPPEDGRVVLSVTNEKTASLVGFGFEDDGWFYNQENAKRGVMPDDIALREERIAWIQPDYVRMFFWYNDWNPSLDAETFTWDSDNMLSHYRTLDLYQRLKARVNVCGVEWAVKDPWENPERLARAIGALMEHLVVTQGYTCIQDYTLTNEPDIFFARSVERESQSFETFVNLHQCVAAEFKRRGLNLNIIGSDDGNNRSWFERCVSDDVYFELSDLFASHFYFPINVVPMVRHIFADRIALLDAREPAKDFIVAELGFSDERMRPPSENPLMQEYSYGCDRLERVVRS